MIVQLEVVRLFVASPSDVQRERNELVKVVDRLNRIFERIKRVRLQLVRWEIDTYPGVGTDAQDVINLQIKDAYDVFLGIMWRRLGTPTGRAESGTIEEYARARTRFDANPSSVHIMWYFKEPSASKGDPPNSNQLKRVKRFREELSDNGVYYSTFRSTARFRDLVDQHLVNFLCDRISRRERDSANDLIQSVAELELVQQQLQTGAGTCSAVGVQIASAFMRLQIVTEDTDSRIRSLIETVDDACVLLIESVFDRRRIALETFATDLERLCPKLGESFDQFTWASIRVLTVAPKLGLPNIKFMLTFVQSQLTPFHKTIQEGVDINLNIQTELAKYPAISSGFQEARTKAHQALDLLVNEYRSIARASGAMIELIQSTIDNHVS